MPEAAAGFARGLELAGKARMIVGHKNKRGLSKDCAPVSAVSPHHVHFTKRWTKADRLSNDGPAACIEEEDLPGAST